MHYPGVEQLGPGANVLSSRKKLRKTLWRRCTSEGKKKKNRFSKLKTERRIAYREQLDKLLEETV